MTYITNVVERSLSLLVSQFKGVDAQGNLTNFQKFIKSFALSIQELEDALNQLKTERNLETAVGVQLDGLGQILGLVRNDGEDDEDYRERLSFQIFINKATGTPEELIAILKFLTKAEKIRYLEYYPGAFQMYTDGLVFPDPPEQIIEALQQASPAAVQYTPITASYGVDVPFVFGADSLIDLLVVTEPSDPAISTNLKLNTTDLLYVNSSLFLENLEGGGFAEFGTPIDTTGAGQLCEVIYNNGSVPPLP